MALHFASSAPKASSGLSGWIVRKRRVLLLFTLAAALLCAGLSLGIRINPDLTVYLPDSSSMKQGIDIMKAEFPGLDLNMATGMSSLLPLWIVVVAVAMVVVLLTLAASSWLEPFLYLASIGVAVLLNAGTNILVGGGQISDVSYSISALLQLVLSIDYSVILSSRWRQERARLSDPTAAMTAAIRQAAGSVLGSGLTTVTGILTLVFMSFRIGAELGIILAKGAAFSMLTIFTVLPSLLLMFQKQIDRTAKQPVTLPVRGLSAFSVRFRYGLLAVFVLMAAALFALRGNTRITFTMETPTSSPFHLAVGLYCNEDEEALAPLIEDLSDDPAVNAVLAWPNTLGAKGTRAELLDRFPALLENLQNAPGILSMLPEEMRGMLDSSGNDTLTKTISAALPLLRTMTARSQEVVTMQDYITELFSLASNPLFKSFLGNADPASLPEKLESASGMLRGTDHSLLILDLAAARESEEAFTFLDRLSDACEKSLPGGIHLVGEGVMAWEMAKTFDEEMNRLTIITALAILVVLLFVFRSPVPSLLLVALIQTAVYATMAIMHWMGSSLYFLAFLIVQSILMGSAVDYAIVYTNYYRELRRTEDVSDAVLGSYQNSISTILTSSLIIITVTFSLGYAFPNPAVGEICHVISLGAASALVMILLLLPGTEAALDRFLIIRSKPSSNKTH